MYHYFFHRLLLLVVGILPASMLWSDEFSYPSLIQCEDFHGLDVNCRLRDPARELAGVQPVHSTFNIIYDMRCNANFASRRPSALQIVVRTDGGSGGSEAIYYNVHGSFAIDGFGPVTITDTNPKNLGYGKFAKGCDLSIKVAVNKSQRSIDEETSTRNHLLKSLDDTLAEVNGNIEQKQKELIKYHSYFVSDAGGKEIFYCLIRTYDDPIYSSSVVQDLKNEYLRQYQEIYEAGKYTCPFSADLSDIVRQCEADPLSARACIAYSSYKRAKEWFTTKLDDFETKFAALTNEDSLTKIQSAKDRLERTLADSESGLQK